MMGGTRMALKIFFGSFFSSKRRFKIQPAICRRARIDGRYTSFKSGSLQTEGSANVRVVACDAAMRSGRSRSFSSESLLFIESTMLATAVRW